MRDFISDKNLQNLYCLYTALRTLYRMQSAMPQSSPKTPSRSRPTTRDTHGEKTPTPDHGSINGYTHGEKTPTPKWFPPQSRQPGATGSSLFRRIRTKLLSDLPPISPLNGLWPISKWRPRS